MINYQPIRARYELAVRDALAGLEPGMVLYYDNVQEEPLPGGSVVEYATITISFPSTSIADICGNMQRILGNVQVNIYGPRMDGMKRLEEAAAAVVCTLMNIHEYPLPENVITHTQGVAGPNPVLSGNNPQALTVVSAPFTARLESD
ncbi:MAG: hypothetical protein VW076_00615 [Synechococcus sp.]|jgi:hypothetical protein